MKKVEYLSVKDLVVVYTNSENYSFSYDGTRDVRDITTCYGAINVEETIYSNIKYLKHIIKSDVNFDKKANKVDCTLIEAAKTD